MAASEPWISLGFGYEACRSRTSDPEKEVLAADVEGELAGFLILDMRGPFAGYIQTVCVDAARRGHGIGSALIRAAEERILRESPNVVLCVSATNDRARALYERLGFAPTNEMRFIGSLASGPT